MAPTRVAVFGLGYVGLPVAQHAVRAGFEVVGFDVASDVVADLNSGRSHVDDIPDAELALMIERGFRATSDLTDLVGIDTFVICVPTPLAAYGGPDLSAVRAAGRLVAGALGRGALVILESTSYPGTTDTELRPILEESGLVAGEDFALCFSPERIDPGNQRFTLANTPKIVGGLTPECRDRGVAFYSAMVQQVVPAVGLREAEMAKLLENTYRHVNIALVNEMARFSADLGIDLWNVIECAATKPFGFQPFYPGPGVGGHCIPIDPNYLSHYVKEEAGYAFRFVELAQEINARMPAYVAERVVDMLEANGIDVAAATVLLLGVTYKADIADLRESPALEVARALRAAGVDLSFHDPHVDEWTVDGEIVQRVDDVEAAARASDCTVLLQAHAGYDPARLAEWSRLLLDTRGVTPRGSARRL